MQSIRALGTVLASVAILAAAAQSAAPPAPPASAPRAVDEAFDFHVEIYMPESVGQQASVNAAAAVQVRQVLEPELASLVVPGQAIETVRATLEAAFPSLVGEAPATVEYYVVWCSEEIRYKAICRETVAFFVMHPEGLVMVDAEELTEI